MIIFAINIFSDVDFNPNKPMTMITCGDDRKIKIWDVRSLKKPLSTLEGHTHWIWCCKYNPFHDQLIVRYCLKNSFVIL